jgi:hypothetical protein
MRQFYDMKILIKSMVYELSRGLISGPKIIYKKSQKLHCYFGNYVVIFSLIPRLRQRFAMEACL